MYRIVFLATDEEMMKIGKSVLSEFGEGIEIRLGILEQGVNVARMLDNEGVDAIITRGGVAFLIKQAGITTPIVEIAITGQDLALAIHEAKQLVGKENPVVGAVAFANMIKDIRVLGSVLNVEIQIYESKGPEDIEGNVLRAKTDGVDVILGGVNTSEMAAKHKLPSVLLKSREGAIREAIKVAKQVAYSRELEKKKSEKQKAIAEEQKTILDYSFDGIISITDKEKITIFNSAAERFFKVKREQVIGLSIREVINVVDREAVNRVLQQGERISGMIIKTSDMSLVLNFSPVTVDGKVTGAILTFQEIDKIQQMEAKIRKEIFLKGHVAQYSFKDIIGESSSIKRTKKIAEQFAKHDSTVLIIGETGTGKELFAQGIHNESLRCNGPFVAVNCGALPPSLLESELFGYVEGAFTGAVKKGKRGIFDIAHTGTIFLDEIAEMDLYGQSRLLRVIQEKQVMRLGDDRVIPIDVRIIAATNKNLLELVKEGKFREDLYYRLKVLTLNIPPLRERPEDIIAILNHYIDEYGRKFYKYIDITEGAKEVICNHSWNGNIRELRSFCEELVATTFDNTVDEGVVKFQLEDRFFQGKGKLTNLNTEEIKTTINIENLSKEDITEVLKRHGGNKRKTAKELGISRTTLWRKLKQYEIN